MNQQQIVSLCGMDATMRSLIGLYCTKQLPETAIADWFAGIQFEALRPEVSCLAAATGAANGYAGVPETLIPRLRGIAKHAHTLNVGMLAGLRALGKRYNEAGIPVVLIGSAAVHLGLPNPPQRYMWHTEVSVPDGDYLRAVKLAADAGFTVEQGTYSSTARCGNTQCVVIYRDMGLAENAVSVCVGGTAFLVPSGPALLVNQTRNATVLLSDGVSGATLIPWLMDLHCVIANISDWKEAAAAVKQEEAAQVRMVLELYNSLVPKPLPDTVLDLFGSEADTTRLAQLLLRLRSLKPGKSKVKRLWIQARIKTETPSAAARAFLTDLRQIGIRKITPGG